MYKKPLDCTVEYVYKVVRCFEIMKRSGWALIAVFVALIAIAVIYLMSNNSEGRDSELIGDRICGNLGSQEGQDACCSERHENDVTIQCVGQWRYDSETRLCGFECEPVVCTQEAMLCPDGSAVGRNSSNNCAFDPCPSNVTVGN